MIARLFALFLIALCEVANAKDCSHMVDHELAKYKMGTFYHPAVNIKKEFDPLSPANGTSFTKKTGDEHRPEIQSVSIFQHVDLLDISQPEGESVLHVMFFSESHGYSDDRRLFLNANCEIWDIEIKNHAQPQYHLDPTACQKKDLKGLAKDLCEEYKGHFVAHSRLPGTPGDGSKPSAQ